MGMHCCKKCGKFVHALEACSIAYDESEMKRVCKSCITTNNSSVASSCESSEILSHQNYGASIPETSNRDKSFDPESDDSYEVYKR